MFSLRKVVLVLGAALFAASLVAASASEETLGQRSGMMRRHADAGRLRAREAAADAALQDMYQEFVTKAKREGRQPLSLDDFKERYPKVVKRSQDENPFAQSSSSSGHGHATSTSSSSSSASASASASGSSPGGDSDHSGEGTYYQPGMGACGKSSSSSDKIVAVAHSMFDQYAAGGNPNANKVCGKKIKATYQGKSTTVTVVDRCTGCSSNDLDFSPAAFKELASTSKGRLSGVKWSFVN